MHILNNEAEGIAERLEFLTPERRRSIVADACKLAGEGLGSVEPEIQDILTTVYETHSLSESQIEEAGSLADAADDRYFTLQEEGMPEGVRVGWFSKARLLGALATGFEGTSWESTIRTSVNGFGVRWSLEKPPKPISNIRE